MLISSIKEILFDAVVVLLMQIYFEIFLSSRWIRTRGTCIYLIFFIWQLSVSRLDFVPMYLNSIITIIITLIIIVITYRGKFWNKCIFVISFDTIWMLLETMCGYILRNYYENYLMLQDLGEAISVFMLIVVIMILKKMLKNEGIKELTTNYSLLLMLIPTGSIFVIYDLFLLNSKASLKDANWSSMAVIMILLVINVLVFFVYLRLADALQLKKCNLAYEQQLELCERYQQEKKLSAMQVRDAKHNMKNHLVTILSYIDNSEYQKAVDFVNDVIEEGGMGIRKIANTGNIVIDSLINYWAVEAEKYGILFSLESFVPMDIPFRGVDLCLILGNALENAVEASRNSDGSKYIHMYIKYNKKNLLISIKNSFNGNVKKCKDGKFRSTKMGEKNHGLGLECIYRMVNKYQGTILIDTYEKKFYLRILLYSQGKIT